MAFGMHTLTNRRTIELWFHVRSRGSSIRCRGGRGAHYLSNSGLACAQLATYITRDWAGSNIPSNTNLNCAKRLFVPRGLGGPLVLMMASGGLGVWARKAGPKRLVLASGGVAGCQRWDGARWGEGVVVLLVGMTNDGDYGADGALARMGWGGGISAALAARP